MADCDRCNSLLHDYQFALVPKGKSIVQVCKSCLIKERFPELKDSKYLDTSACVAAE